MMLESKFAVSTLLTVFLFIQTSYIDGYVHPPRRCQLPMDHGDCYARLPRYYFNMKHGRCEQFVYGGCGGNENRFNTKAQCEAACNLKLTPDINSDYSDEDPNIYQRWRNPYARYHMNHN